MAYQVISSRQVELSREELESCVTIIQKGSAVDPASAATELPKATALAAVLSEKIVVGVGAVKRLRQGYAARISKRSGFAIDASALELGYVAVDEAHRGHRLSGMIVAELLSTIRHRPLFATTDDEHMKKTLTRAGFKQEGKEWQGERSILSLWILRE